MNAQILEKETVDKQLIVRTQSRAWWKRRRLQLAALSTAAVVVAVIIANAVIATRYTPTAAVTDYLNAVSAGDSSLAWERIQVLAPPQSVVANLTDQSALRAALTIGHPDIRGFNVTDVTYLDPAQRQARVSFDYDTPQGTRQTSFTLQRLSQAQVIFYPTWRIVLTPMLITIQDPADGPDTLSIDGKSLAVTPGTTSVVAILPLTHRFAFAGTAMLQPQSILVDDFGLQAESVAYRPVLTPDGLARAKAAVGAAINACAQMIGPHPDGCPQSYNEPFADTGRWTLVGDPTQDLALGFGQDSKLIATGHFQMVFAYPAGSSGIRHQVAAGGYSAELGVGTDDITVKSLNPTGGLPPLQRPAAAPDQMAVGLVRAGFTACVAIKVPMSADCPQGILSAMAQNVRWKQTGDPTAGATVTFDPETGIFTVHGSFDMRATYTINGYPSSAPSYTNAYNATLLWDGSQLQLVAIDGTFS